jgi:hypothetical protein
MPSYSQWHYLLGYLIVTVSHNVPIMICLILGFSTAVRLYRQPNRPRVQAFFGWLLLGFCYEYAKHLGDYLVEPVFFLLILDWTWLQAPAAIIVQLVVPSLILVVAVYFLTQSLELDSKLRQRSSVL